jgi:hypothetical protein
MGQFVLVATPFPRLKATKPLARTQNSIALIITIPTPTDFLVLCGKFLRRVVSSQVFVPRRVKPAVSPSSALDSQTADGSRLRICRAI